MLGDQESIATVAVRDIDAARAFYEGTLGLSLLHIRDGQVLTYKTGKGRMLVYRSEYAGGNRATAVTWLVGSGVDAQVRDLKAKGVAFEHYEMPNTRLEGDIHVTGELRVAWFKDPDGNIHALGNG